MSPLYFYPNLIHPPLDNLFSTSALGLNIIDINAQLQDETKLLVPQNMSACALSVEISYLDADVIYLRPFLFSVQGTGEVPLKQELIEFFNSVIVKNEKLPNHGELYVVDVPSRISNIYPSMLRLHIKGLTAYTIPKPTSKLNIRDYKRSLSIFNDSYDIDYLYSKSQLLHYIRQIILERVSTDGGINNSIVVSFLLHPGCTDVKPSIIVY
jgi:hypothetical protein